MQNELNYSKKNKKNNIKINLKKRKIIKVAEKSQILNHKIITINLISSGTLDSTISLLNKEKIITTNNSLIKKGYLTSEEQFISIIDNFITYFFNIFGTISNLNIISECLNSDKNNTLLSKKYFYDNNYIDCYTNSFNLMIINNFYHNARVFKNELKSEFTLAGLKLEKNDLKNTKKISKIINLLEELCFVNKNNYSLLSLFTLADENYDMYLKEWEAVFDTYLTNIDFIHEYQKFKNRNNRLL